MKPSADGDHGDALQFTSSPYASWMTAMFMARPRWIAVIPQDLMDGSRVRDCRSARLESGLVEVLWGHGATARRTVSRETDMLPTTPFSGLAVT